MRGAARRAALAALGALCAGGAARADVRMTVLPMLGTEAVVGDGWTPLSVRVENSDKEPLVGLVRASAEGRTSDRRVTASEAAVNVPPGATVVVRLPLRILGGWQAQVRLLDGRGEVRQSETVPAGGRREPLLVDLHQPSRLGSMRSMRVNIGFDPERGSRSSSAATLMVGAVATDPTTGDLVVPARAVEWGLATVVLAPSDLLARMSAPEQQALADHVLAGGTLAVTVRRPEDLRQGLLPRLLGGAVESLGVAKLLGQLGVEAPVSNARGGGGGSSPGGSLVKPRREVAEALQLYGGANLKASEFGASAPYGLGEVHLLAFDPSRTPDVDDPWVQGQLVGLARHAWDRRAFQVLPPNGGSADVSTMLRSVRSQLDPNAQSYWAIALATLLLLAYAVVAGPVNFLLSARAGKPLRALVVLPVLSALAFGLVVVLAAASKGVRGRSDRLSLVETAGGVGRGSIRRYRGYFTPTAQRATVAASGAQGLPWVLDEGGDQASLVVGRAGIEVRDVDVLPWQSLVVREDDIAELGEGVTLQQEPGDVRVVNRTGRALRGLVVHVPGRGLHALPSLADGATALASSGKLAVTAAAMGATPGGGPGASAMGMTLHWSELGTLRSDLEAASDGLGSSWEAIESLAGHPVDWWPDDQPALLAQVDGGEGRATDQGLPLKRDRLLVRVVGAGGRP